MRLNLGEVEIIRKILKHCRNVLRYTSGVKSIDEFSINSEKQDAVVFNILQIGELANERLSFETRKQMRDIPWQAIIDMRHKLVHHYDSYNVSFVWDVVKDDIPELVKALESVSRG